MINKTEQWRLDLIDRISKDYKQTEHRSVLCLGEYAEASARAFTYHGDFAVGIDPKVEPGSKYVLPGSLDRLQFTDSSVDVVYAHQAEASTRLPDIIAELYRVTKTGGYIILEYSHTEPHPMIAAADQLISTYPTKTTLSESCPQLHLTQRVYQKLR